MGPRVAIDATALLGVQTGVGAFVSGLVSTLADRHDLELVAYALTWRGRSDLGAVLPPGVEPAPRPFPARLTRALWRRTEGPRIERWTGPVDVVHATNNVAPPRRAPTIITVHDVTYLRYPQHATADARDYPGLLRRALDRGAVLHTYTDFVAGELAEHYRLAPERVVRIAPGLRPSAPGDPNAGRTLAGAARYVLSIGTVEPRKNLPALVRAFDSIAADRPDVDLVVAGPDGWGVDAFDAAVASARHRDRVRRLGYISSSERADLLAGAAALAYPSIYEGFGFPPLEAMQVGTPVVASSAGPLPDVLGDAALLPDPNDVDELATALTRVLDDDHVVSRLVAAGRERAARYTWARAGAEFVTTYRALASART